MYHCCEDYGRATEQEETHFVLLVSLITVDIEQNLYERVSAGYILGKFTGLKNVGTQGIIR